LDSVINQTYRNLEILLIDDGSKDRSGAICDEYAQIDSRIQVFHIPNGGVSHARNIGLDHAKGVYVQFIDSDDYIHLDMTRLLLESAQQYNSDIVFCGFNIVQNGVADEEITCNISPKRMGIDEILLLLSEADCNKLFYSDSNKLYRRASITKNKIRFREDMTYGEDFVLNLELIVKSERFSFVNQTLYQYDTTIPNSLTKTKLSNICKNLIKAHLYYRQVFIDCNRYELYKTKQNKSLLTRLMMLCIKYRITFVILPILYIRAALVKILGDKYGVLKKIIFKNMMDTIEANASRQTNASAAEKPLDFRMRKV